MAPSNDEETPLIAPTPREGGKDWTQWTLVLMTLVLLLGGGIAAMLLEGWSPITAFYVIAQIVTTVGYGDFTVTSDSMKLFCAFYVILVLIFGAYAFNQVFAWVNDVGMTLVRKELRAVEAHVQEGGSMITALTKRATTKVITSESEELKMQERMRAAYGQHNELVAATVFVIFAIGFGTIFFATYEACSCSYGLSAVDGCVESPYEQCVATGGYKKTWVSSFYMSVITLTTVGFGDHSPRSKVGRIVASFWMLIGVGIMANWFSALSKFFFERAKDKTVKLKKRFTKDVFNRIDKDGNGQLTRAEFQSFFLVEAGLVSQEELDLIDKEFYTLDKDNKRYVTYADVEKVM